MSRCEASDWLEVWLGWGREGWRVRWFASMFDLIEMLLCVYHLIGLVVKASASRAEGPGFGSRLRQDFVGVESYQ